MSQCIDELEHTSQLYMYGDQTSSETPAYALGTVNNCGTSSPCSSPAYPPVDVPWNYQHPMNYPSERGKQSYTTYASVETGVSDDIHVETPTSSRENQLEQLRHVSLCQVDIQKRTVSAPQGVTGFSVHNDCSAAAGQKLTEEEVLHRQTSSPPGWTIIQPATSTEQMLDPQDFPFEPRPAWEEHPHPNLRGVSSSHIVPSEQALNPSQYDLPSPSTPTRPPRKAKCNPSPKPMTATYRKSTDGITLSPNISTSFAHDASRDSPMPEDGSPPRRDRRSTDLEEGHPVPPKRGVKSPKQHSETVLQSKEKEDQAYTEALLMHQRARYERLCKELLEEKKKLIQMKEQTFSMEGEAANKRNHRSPFPTQEEISLLREQKRQLQIDIECMNREIETYKSQGLMDLSQASSFYGNMGTTGAPGPVLPISSYSSAFQDTVAEIPTPPPSYDEVMEGWSCSACTLRNPPTSSNCECCETPR